MSVKNTTLSPEILCNAVRDVTGLNFDPTDSSDVAAAAVVVQKLSGDFELISALADSVTLHSQSGDSNVATEEFSVQDLVLRRVDERVGINDFLADDLPSESTSEAAMNLVSANTTTAKASDAFISEDIDALISRYQNSFVFYSPEVLGFKPKAAKVDWTHETEDKWDKFLCLVEKKLSAPQSLLGRTWKDLRSKLIYSAEHKAKNYGVVNLKGGKGKSSAHFLFDPNTLYVLVIHNEMQTLHSTVEVNDIDRFTKNIVDAFGGREEYAKGTLASLRSALSH